MKLSIVFLAGLLLVFAGCSGLQFENVSSSNTVQQDHYDCTTQWDRSGMGIVYAADPVGHISYIYQARQDLIACMERKGWKRTQGETGPPPGEGMPPGVMRKK
jgi:hypothetical protein